MEAEAQPSVQLAEMALLSVSGVCSTIKKRENIATESAPAASMGRVGSTNTCVSIYSLASLHHV